MQAIRSALSSVPGLALRFPIRVLLVLVALTGLFGWYGLTHFDISSDLGRMIRQQADWRDDFDHFQERFPEVVKNAFVVISGDSLDAVERTSLAVEARLRAQPEQFAQVYSPANDPFFRDHAFLYMPVDELDATLGRLGEAQPALAALSEDPSLRGLLGLFTQAIQQRDQVALPTALGDMANEVAAAARDVDAGGDGHVAWSDLFFDAEGTSYRIIFVKHPPDFADAIPNASLMAALRETVDSVPESSGVAVRITGEVALAYEEVTAARDGAGFAGTISALILMAVLIVGVRSLRVVTATFLVLSVGILWTMAYASVAVGTYNTLSIVFLVMFFGLAIDFAIHFCLRFQEALRDEAAPAAMATTVRSVGGALALCAVTSSLGFASFIPTDYVGLGELGIISAGGMAVALILTFVLIPAFFGLAGPPNPLPGGDKDVVTAEHPESSAAAVCNSGRDRWILLLALLVVGGAAWLGSGWRFDFSVMALKDPSSESVVTLKELQDAGVATDYLISVAADDSAHAQVIKEQLAPLPEVSEVTLPIDQVPDEQLDKLDLIFDAADLLLPALEPYEVQAPADEAARLAAVTEYLQAAANLDPSAMTGSAIEKETEAEQLQALRDLAQALQGLIDDTTGSAQDLALQQLERGVIDPLVEEMDWLLRALDIDEIGFEDLPSGLRNRLLGEDGSHLVTVQPSQDIGEVDTLDRFISAVRGQVPHATGRPVMEWGVGGVVTGAFMEALVYALVSIAMVLLVVLRSVRYTILVLVPLVSAAVCTAGTAVLMDVSLNMANIIVLPLVFGLGVDNGVHVVDRFRHTSSVTALMQSSTPRAVVLSSLTTAGTFAALSLSPHQGTASIGELLAVAIGWLLLFTVGLLPALLRRFG